MKNNMSIDVESYIGGTEKILRVIELFAALVLIIVFCIGVVDICIAIYNLFKSGQIVNTSSLFSLIDKFLILFIIVELYKTVIAYAEGSEIERIVEIVLLTAIIAVARKIVIFRTGEFTSYVDALQAALSYLAISVSLAALYYTIRAMKEKD